MNGRYATSTVVRYRGAARRTEITGIEQFLETCKEVGSFQVQKEAGLIVVAADVLARDIGHASEVAARVVRGAMEAAGWNRMTTLWETVAEPPVGTAQARPRGLSQLGYAA